MLFTCAQWLTVDALVPPSLHLALPNLRSVKQQQCDMSPAAATSQLDSGCGGIHHVTVSLGRRAPALPAQLAQLPSLRGLTSLTLHNRTSTPFLPSLSSQLTALELGYGFRVYSVLARCAPAEWVATLRNVAQCTRLRSLTLPATTAEELRPVATALTQLRRLHLSHFFDAERDGGAELQLDGDAMVDLLLGLTHLTSLRWQMTPPYVMRRSHASRPCSWRELAFYGVSAHQLVRLPLHSLTSPVDLEAVFIGAQDSVADVQGLVSVLAGAGGPGVRWKGSVCSVRFNNWRTGSDTFVHGATAADTPAALLRALQPLMAGAAEVDVRNIEWGAEAVRALPQSCERLGLLAGEVPLAATVEMARCLHQLERVRLESVVMEPWAVVAYVAAEEGARSQAREVGQGGPGGGQQGRRVRVEVSGPVAPDDAEEDQDAAWDRMLWAVQALRLPWLDLAAEG